MALTFEYEQKIADGTKGMALEYPNEKVQAFAQDGSGNLKGSTAEVDAGDFSPTITFTSVGTCAKQASVQYSSLHMYSTNGIYGSWKYGDKQQLVIFLLEYDLTNKLRRANINYDISRPGASCSLEFVETADLLIEEQRSILDPGAKIRVRFKAGDSNYYDMGFFYADRSSGQDKGKVIRIEARGMIGKPLQDQSFDERYDDYSYDNAADVIEDILSDAGYDSDEYRVDTTTESIGMEYDRKKKIYDGLMEIIDALDWQLKERPEGYLVVGPSTYSEFDTVSDYEFEYGIDCYSRGFTLDDSHAYTRVCVHTADYSVAVFDDVDVYTSWKIGEQKTYYHEVPDGTTSSDATTIAADLATKFGNSGTIETFSGPFRPYLIPGDTAKITKDGTERTVGVITNIRHEMGQSGFKTTFDVDSGGVVGIGRMKDYIDKLQKKPISESTRSYS